MRGIRIASQGSVTLQPDSCPRYGSSTSVLINVSRESSMTEPDSRSVLQGSWICPSGMGVRSPTEDARRWWRRHCIPRLGFTAHTEQMSVAAVKGKREKG